MRTLVRPASTPQPAVANATVSLLVTDQADSTRVTRSAGVRSRRYVAYTGLKTAQLLISANSTAITSSKPARPGRTKASPIDHSARTVPAVSSTSAGRNG